MIPWTFYEPMKSGTWRLRARLVSPARLAYVVDRFPEGTVYRLWLGPVLVRLMVKR